MVDISDKKEKPKQIGQQLTVGDLRNVHEQYEANEEEWEFLLAMYEGIRKIIKNQLIRQHERESDISYERRMEELYGLGYTKSVVEIFQFYLFKAPDQHKLGRLHDYPLWDQFQDDADLYGNNYDAVMMELALFAGVQGHMGILVDKANVGDLETLEFAIENRVYPYIAKYHPKAILDWEYKRNELGRPYLSYIKLKDDDERYRIWTVNGWELWEIPKDDEGNDMSDDAEAELVEEGFNPLGIVPFIWHYNLRSKDIGVGVSDVHEVSRIDLSIIRNISQIEEIINYAAFPMMRKPMRDANPAEVRAPQGEDEVGVKAILEFDPEHPESKPDWLPAEVQGSVSAVQGWIENKVREIYRAANIGGLASTEPTSNPQSGVAKKIDFQMLNAKLVNKSINLEETENRLLEFWLRWEGLWYILKDEAQMGRERTYDVEDVATDLENALTAQMVIQSESFNKHLMKSLVRQMLPTLGEYEIQEIDEEIDALVFGVPEGEEAGMMTEENAATVAEGQEPDQEEESTE